MAIRITFENGALDGNGVFTPGGGSKVAHIDDERESRIKAWLNEFKDPAESYLTAFVRRINSVIGMGDRDLRARSVIDGIAIDESMLEIQP